MKQALPVRHYGSNQSADYYKVNGAFNVLDQSGVSERFVCLDCKSNRCDHIEAVKEHIGTLTPSEIAA